jgi:hypothetical protein
MQKLYTELLVVQKGKWRCHCKQEKHRRKVIKANAMNRTYEGVQFQSKKYAYHLKFVREIAPKWVLEALRNVSADDSIGFEDEANVEEKQVQEMIAEVERQEIKTGVQDNNIEMLGDKEET